MINKILIAGCGQLGSRHLQALKNVKQNLEIYVFDPNQASLDTASERFEAIDGIEHKVIFSVDMFSDINFSIAIVATSSNVRRQVIKDILQNNNVKFFILEKILFNKKEDYFHVAKLLDNSNSRAWVNCSMRMMPFYKKVKREINGSVVNYRVSGSNYGLVTNAIHYIDHMAHLNNCTDFSVNTDGLESELINSKRAGFSELTGTIFYNFDNGSSGVVSCYKGGDLPLVVEIDTERYRCISRETEGKAWVAKKDDSWIWKELDAKVPYQSQMTAWIIEDLLKNESCDLPEYSESMKIHLNLFEKLQEFLKDKKLTSNDIYPFT